MEIIDECLGISIDDTFEFHHDNPEDIEFFEYMLTLPVSDKSKDFANYAIHELNNRKDVTVYEEDSGFLNEMKNAIN